MSNTKNRSILASIFQIITIISFLSLIGCSGPIGQLFDYHQTLNLKLGKTTKQETVAMFGDSYDVRPDSKNNYEIWEYSYIPKFTGSPHSDIGTVAKRYWLLLAFSEGILHEYKFEAQEGTYANDFSSAATISVGKSEKEEVLQLLPEPSGKAFCPSILYEKTICENGSELFFWFSCTQNTIKIVRNKWVGNKTLNSLVVVFDAEGIVTQVGKYY